MLSDHHISLSASVMSSPSPTPPPPATALLRPDRGLNDLPDEVILRIFGSLEAETLMRLSGVNSRKDILSKLKKFWRF
jgi:hypothetical protein